VLRGGLGLVQALEGPVVALVEPPAAVHGDPHQVEPVEGQPEGADGPLEDGGVGHVEGEAGLGDLLGGPLGLLDALVGQVDVGPAREAVLLVPDGLAVAEQDEGVHESISRGRWSG
jgi:hypothetical protein